MAALGLPEGVVALGFLQEVQATEEGQAMEDSATTTTLAILVVMAALVHLVQVVEVKRCSTTASKLLKLHIMVPRCPTHLGWQAGIWFSYWRSPGTCSKGHLLYS